MTAAEFQTGINNILDNTPKKGVNGSSGITKAIFKTIVGFFKDFFATVEASNDAVLAAAAALTNPFINYATNKGWANGNVTAGAPQTGFFGGNFTLFGSWTNVIDNGINPFGLPDNIWKANLTTGTPAGWAGGFSKESTNLAANKSYIVASYFRKTTTGNESTMAIYFGCSDVDTWNLNNTANGGPYFASIMPSAMVQNEWYVGIGIIHSNNTTVVTSLLLGGIYRLSTGEKVAVGTDYKMKTASVAQKIRNMVFTPVLAGNVNLEFANPFFAEITSDIGDAFYLLGLNSQFPFFPDKITITPPVGTSMVYNLRRPYKFAYTLIYNDGLTLVAQPAATVAANTDAFLTITNATVGKSVTVQIVQIP